MKSLKERWIAALKNPIWWAIIVIWIIFIYVFVTADGSIN